MKTVRLSDVIFKNSKVRRELGSYLFRLQDYRQFKPDMKFIIWTRSSDNDFVAMEAKDTLLCYHSKSYRPSFFLSHDVNMCLCSYKQLLAYVF